MKRRFFQKIWLTLALTALAGLCACTASAPAETPAPTPTPSPSPTPEPLPEVAISEVMSRNRATLLDENGRFSPWVELVNTGTDAAVLTGCRLECGGDSLPVSGLTLAAGERALLFCPEEGAFSLPEQGGTLILYSAQGTELARFALPALEEDRSACLGEDGEIAVTERPSPGFANSREGFEAFAASRPRPAALAINEVMVYNEWYMPQNGEYADWVELKNLSAAPVLLSDYYLADGGGGCCRLPEETLEPGALRVLLCGDEGELSFSLNAREERLYLSDSAGAVADYALLTGLRLGGSYGRLEGQEGYFYFDGPTPGQENAGGARTIAPAPELLGRDGVFEGVESVTAELTAGGEIHYTLDGSDPTADSPLYQGPLSFTETCVLRAVNLEAGALPSESLDLSFIINEGHSFPVVSLVMDPEDLNGVRGIYSHPTEDWENPGTVMVYDGEGGFRLGCGVKMHGATSRVAQRKKSFKLNFRDRYGGELDYDLFGNGVTNFSSILLRADQEEHFSTMMRDNIMHQLAIQCFPELPCQDYRCSVLYLNGEYWGIYNIREAHSPTHYANHYGYDVDTVSQWKGQWPYGSNPDRIYQFALSHDMSDDENYNYVASHLNIDSIIGWCVVETFSGNFDINSPNMRFYYSPEDDKLTYALVDLDLGMFEYYGFGSTFGFGYAYNNYVLRLMKNSQFREQFLTRMAQALEGPMSKENVIALIDAMEEELRPEIPRNCERWGNTLAGWERMVEGLRWYVTAYNVPRAMVRSIGSCFNLSSEELEQYFANVE